MGQITYIRGSPSGPKYVRDDRVAHISFIHSLQFWSGMPAYMQCISKCSQIPTVAFVFGGARVADGTALLVIESFLYEAPAALALQDLTLECVSAFTLDSEPWIGLSVMAQNLEERMLSLASESRLRCFTIEFPERTWLARWQQTLQRLFPQLHAKNILKFRCLGESSGDDGGRTLLIRRCPPQLPLSGAPVAPMRLLDHKSLLPATNSGALLR